MKLTKILNTEYLKEKISYKRIEDQLKKPNHNPKNTILKPKFKKMHVLNFQMHFGIEKNMQSIFHMN